MPQTPQDLFDLDEKGEDQMLSPELGPQRICPTPPPSAAESDPAPNGIASNPVSEQRLPAQVAQHPPSGSSQHQQVPPPNTQPLGVFHTEFGDVHFTPSLVRPQETLSVQRGAEMEKEIRSLERQLTEVRHKLAETRESLAEAEDQVTRTKKRLAEVEGRLENNKQSLPCDEDLTE